MGQNAGKAQPLKTVKQIIDPKTNPKTKEEKKKKQQANQKCKATPKKMLSEWLMQYHMRRAQEKTRRERETLGKTQWRAMNEKFCQSMQKTLYRPSEKKGNTWEKNKETHQPKKYPSDDWCHKKNRDTKTVKNQIKHAGGKTQGNVVDAENSLKDKTKARQALAQQMLSEWLMQKNVQKARNTIATKSKINIENPQEKRPKKS